MRRNEEANIPVFRKKIRAIFVKLPLCIEIFNTRKIAKNQLAPLNFFGTAGQKKVYFVIPSI